MKVAFFHELHFGGARRVVREYGKIFKKYHAVSLYYVGNKNDGDFSDVFSDRHFYHYSVNPYVGKNWKRKFYKDFIEPFQLYWLHKRIARDIDNQKYDFVFVHPSQFTHAPFLLKFLKTPSVYFCHEPLRIAYDPLVAIPQNISYIKKLYENLIRNLRRYIDTSNIKKAHLVLANSDYSKRNIKRAYGINAEICYLGIDPKLFRPLIMKKEYDLLFVGDNVWLEGYDTFEEVQALFKNTLKIFIVKKQKGRYISDKELVSYYNKSRLITVLGRCDPFSMIPLEAMACEVPPLVVKEGGPIEAVKDKKTGFLIERDPSKFYSMIKKLLNDKKLCNQIGKQGRENILSFWTWEESYNRFMKIIKTSRLIKE